MHTSLGLLWVAWAAGASGFRHDGSGVWPAAQPPSSFSRTEAVVWRAPMPSWSNGSPVVHGDRVCVTAEPVSVICLDAATGAVAWQASLPVVDALPPDLAATIRPGVDEASAREALLPGLMEEQSRLRRAVRAGDGAAVAALEAISAKVMAVREGADTYRPYLTPPVLEQVGWSTPTPLSDGRSLWVLVGNGVVARFEGDGRRVWARWLGEGASDMRGFTRGTTASPILVDGTLVVGHRILWGLDPVTGAVRWQGPGWTDYGTPTVARVGGVAVLITPNGLAVRVSDGKVVGRDLGDVYFVSPLSDGDVLWYVGGHTGGHQESTGSWATRLKLAWQGETLTATKAWTVTLPSKDRVFSQPVRVDGAVHVVQEGGTYTVLDEATGAVRRTAARVSSACSMGYFSAAAVAGGAVWFGCEAGKVLRATAESTTVMDAEPLRSSPVFAGKRVYLRTFDAVWAFGI